MIFKNFFSEKKIISSLFHLSGLPLMLVNAQQTQCFHKRQSVKKKKRYSIKQFITFSQCPFSSCPFRNEYFIMILWPTNLSLSPHVTSSREVIKSKWFKNCNTPKDRASNIWSFYWVHMKFKGFLVEIRIIQKDN